jgi:two-component system, NarL family, invasion response regulator UvrY
MVFLPASVTGEKAFAFLIVSDFPIFAVGLGEVIAKNFNARIHRVQKVREALELCATVDFDVILLGVTRPERSGLDLLPDFKKRSKKSRILIASLLAEEQFAARALKAGAAGYILKTSSEDEVVRAIRVVLNGHIYVSQAFAGRIAESLGKNGHKPHELLSPREFEVFLRIARGGSAKEIAGQLSLSVKTISSYHTHILAKLNVRNDAELGEYALRNRLVA